MKILKNKCVPFLMAALLLLSAIPTMVFAAADVAVVSNEADLRAAIDAIPTGGSGEITIGDGDSPVYLYLNEGLYIEYKDVTFNLVDAALVTAKDEEYGLGQPVIFGFGANITVNLDDNSFMYSEGHTGNYGVVCIENSTEWDETTQTFEKTFTLTVNGGQYFPTEEIPEDHEADYAFIAAPGTKVVLSDVVCYGDVKPVDRAGVGIDVPGELVINGGKFTNDVSEYAVDGKVTCVYGENYYVREKEMTDAFSKVLTDGKIVFKYAKPTAYDEAAWLIAEEFNTLYPDFYLDPAEGFNDDFSKLELGMHWDTAKEEFHVVDVVWDYDADVLQTAQSFIEKFPEDRPWFNVSDLELVNYWAYSNPDSEIDSLANYSGELKSILGNSNFLYTIEDRGGADDVFYTERIGSAKLMHNGKVYYATTMMGARAQHAIYVPESTDDTKEALMAAAQKRIDAYIGENVVKITASDETVTAYYENESANYDTQLATAQSELAEAQATLAAEQAKDPSLWDWDVILQCQFKIMECEWNIEYIPQYKQYFFDSFEEGGDLHFLKNATGDFLFNVEVLEKEQTYKFVIIKDDTKLAVPTYSTVDLNTNITVSTASTALPLDTVVEVNKLTGGTEYDRIVDILDVEENEMFDIKLHSASLDTHVTKLENGKFEVKIPVPEKLAGKTLVVYYVDGEGEVTPHEVTPQGNFAVFQTDHFSIYTLAAKTGGSGSANSGNASAGGSGSANSGNVSADGSGSANSGNVSTGGNKAPATGDNSTPLLWALSAIISGGVFVTLLLKRKQTA